jgi:hypothetical protein
MRLIYSLILIILLAKAYSQDTYFEAGLNLSSYDFKSPQLSDNLKLSPSNAIFFRFGLSDYYSPSINYGLSFQQFNASGEQSNYLFDWKTNYIGGFFQYNVFLNRKESFYINSSLEILTLLSGKQMSYGEVYKLSEEDEFSGVWLNPRLGLTYNLIDSRSLTLGVIFNFSYSMNLINDSDQKLSFLTNQLGIRFML